MEVGEGAEVLLGKGGIWRVGRWWCGLVVLKAVGRCVDCTGGVGAGGGGARERRGEMPSESESESSGLVLLLLGWVRDRGGLVWPVWIGGGRRPRGWGGLLLAVGSAAWLESSSSESQLNRGGEVVMMRGLGGRSWARPRSRMGARGGGGK
jgi:hypothetical protein